MRTHVIIFGGVYFCVVFTVEQGVPHIVAKHSTQVSADLHEWLAQNTHPTNGLLLLQHHGANLPHGYYIKPYEPEHYFRVYEDNQTEEVNADQFDVPIVTQDGF